MLTVSGQFCRYLQGAAFMLLKGTFGTPDGTPNWSSSEPRRPKGAWCHLQCRHASRAGALRHFNIKSVISGPPQLTSDLNGQGFCGGLHSLDSKNLDRPATLCDFSKNPNRQVIVPHLRTGQHQTNLGQARCASGNTQVV